MDNSGFFRHKTSGVSSSGRSGTTSVGARAKYVFILVLTAWSLLHLKG